MWEAEGSKADTGIVGTILSPRSALGKALSVAATAAAAANKGTLHATVTRDNCVIERRVDEEAQAKNQRALCFLLILMLSNTAVQFAMGFLGNSLSILGDAIWGLVDCVTYVFNLIAEKHARGNKWLPHAAAVVSMIMLIGACVFVFVEAHSRVQDDCTDCGDVGAW